MKQLLKAIKRRIDEILIANIIAAFPKGFGQELRGTAGVITTTRPCGCVIKAEHIPEKCLWILTSDYSNCKHRKRR